MAQRDLFSDEQATDTAKRDRPPHGKPRVRAVARDQLGLEVVDLESLIPEEHPARTLWAAVEHLDLSLFYEQVAAREAAQARFQRGQVSVGLQARRA